MQERREFSRVRYGIEAQLVHAGETFASDLVDLSLKGILVNTAASPRKGRKVEVVFRPAQETAEEIRCGGTVVRADHRGLGIMFDEVDLASFNWIRQIVSANSGSPEQVESEFAAFLQSRASENV